VSGRPGRLLRFGFPSGPMSPKGHVLRALLRRVHPEPLAAKVPEVAALFWVVKLLTTAGGEATSDYFGDINVLIGGSAELLILGVALTLQLRSRRYVAWRYWSLAFAIAIFGTGVSDTLHVALGIPYAATTALWAVVLTVTFWRWHRSEGTLSIHSILTARRERYYWATVFATFALGTALGDFTASVVGLGFLPSAVLFAVVIVLPALAWRLGLDAVAAFWAAYVVTRPLGASFSDYLSKPHAISGANFGDGPTALVLLAATAIPVVCLAVARTDIQPVSETGATTGRPVVPGRSGRRTRRPGPGPEVPAWPEPDRDGS
jgi:uncharacterized membrane-anchored protein